MRALFAPHPPISHFKKYCSLKRLKMILVILVYCCTICMMYVYVVSFCVFIFFAGVVVLFIATL